MSLAVPCTGSVHGHALGGVARHRVAASQVGQVAAAAEQGGHIAALAALGQRAIDERAHARVQRKVLVDVALGFLLIDSSSPAETECRYPVEDGKVGALGDRPLQRRDGGRSQLEDFRSRARMNVSPRRNDSMIAGSPLMCARMRSSICE